MASCKEGDKGRTPKKLPDTIDNVDTIDTIDVVDYLSTGSLVCPVRTELFLQYLASPTRLVYHASLMRICRASSAPA